jgi:hypothetical protein
MPQRSFRPICEEGYFIEGPEEEKSRQDSFHFDRTKGQQLSRGYVSTAITDQPVGLLSIVVSSDGLHLVAQENVFNFVYTK